MKRPTSAQSTWKPRALAQIVCWKCKSGYGTLYRLRDKYGFKTPDYSCREHLIDGLPDTPNQSFIAYPSPEEMERMKQLLAERDGDGAAVLPTHPSLAQG